MPGPHFLSMEPLLSHVNLAGAFYASPPVGEPDEPAEAGGMWRGRVPLANGVQWVIVGGESGNRARPSHPYWFRSVRDQCAAAGVPFMFKQWGEWVPRGPESVSPNYVSVDGVPRVRLSVCGCNSSSDRSGPGGVPGAFQRHDCDLSRDSWMNRAGKKCAGRMLDGVLHDAFPESFGVTHG